MEPAKTSGLAVASLVLGILSITIIPILPAIPAIICGHISRSRIKQAGASLRGEGMALAGLITGYVSAALIPFAILAGLALPVFGEVQLRGKQTSSLAHAKQIALGCKLYALDHQGSFPASIEQLVPEYLPDRAVLVCPLSGPSVPIGYEYFGGKETDPSEKILLVSKAADRRGRRVVVHVDASGQIEKYPPGPPAK